VRLPKPWCCCFRFEISEREREREKCLSFDTFGFDGNEMNIGGIFKRE
jgi:hypothetical protein